MEWGDNGETRPYKFRPFRGDMMYIVRSGDGYVFDAETLEMIGNRKNQSDAAMRAVRMPPHEAYEVCERMIKNGFVAEVVEVRIGNAA